MARTRRAKLQAAAWYHLIARVTDRQFLLESDEQKAHLADLLRRTLEFSGVELGTYVIMDNHFHLFVRVPEARELDDGEILRRIAVLNGQERADEVEEKWAPCGDRPLNFLAVNAEVELGLAHRARMWYDSRVMFKGALYLKRAMCLETSCLSAVRGRVVRVFTSNTLSNTLTHQSLKRYTQGVLL